MNAPLAPAPAAADASAGSPAAPAGATQYVARLVRPEIRALSAYHVPPAAGMVKLDAMENPYRLPEPTRGRLGARLAEVALNRYPDPSGSVLKQALRRFCDVPRGLELVLGNGSDEVLLQLALLVGGEGRVMLAPDPTFVMYRMCAAFTGMRYVGVALRDDFTLDEPAMLEALARERPALVFLAWPNNPTGTLFPERALERIARACPGLVVIDEAYHAFADASFVPRLAEFPNVVVTRTLSKLGLAGLRLGFAVAAPEWAEQIEKVRLPYNVNALSQEAALAVLSEPGVLLDQAAAMRAGRERLFASLGELPGVRAFESHANFVLARFPDATAVFEGLKARGILVKNLHGWHPLLAQCLRISVGTPEEIDALLAALGELCRS